MGDRDDQSPSDSLSSLQRSVERLSRERRDWLSLRASLGPLSPAEAYALGRTTERTVPPQREASPKHLEDERRALAQAARNFRDAREALQVLQERLQESRDLGLEVDDGRVDAAEVYRAQAQSRRLEAALQDARLENQRLRVRMDRSARLIREVHEDAERLRRSAAQAPAPAATPAPAPPPPPAPAPAPAPPVPVPAVAQPRAAGTGTGATGGGGGATVVPGSGTFLVSPAGNDLKLEGRLTLRKVRRARSAARHSSGQHRPATGRDGEEARRQNADREGGDRRRQQHLSADGLALRDESDYQYLRAAVLSLADERDELRAAVESHERAAAKRERQRKREAARVVALEADLARAHAHAAEVQAALERKGWTGGDIGQLVDQLAEKTAELMRVREHEKSFRERADRRTAQLEQGLRSTSEELARVQERLASSERALAEARGGTRT